MTGTDVGALALASLLLWLVLGALNVGVGLLGASAGRAAGPARG
jgi:hypothetical protein